MSHTVTITRLPNDSDDDIEFEFGGAHDARCETYQECNKAWHRHPKNRHGLLEEWGNARVGEHAYIDRMWMVPKPNGCGLDYVFEQEPPESYLADAGLGTHDVEVWWDGDCWSLTVVSKSHDVQTGGPDGRK